MLDVLDATRVRFAHETGAAGTAEFVLTGADKQLVGALRPWLPLDPPR